MALHTYIGGDKNLKNNKNKKDLCLFPRFSEVVF
jgi:hypothetical protein